MILIVIVTFRSTYNLVVTKWLLSFGDVHVNLTEFFFNSGNGNYFFIFWFANIYFLNSVSRKNFFNGNKSKILIMEIEKRILRRAAPVPNFTGAYDILPCILLTEKYIPERCIWTRQQIILHLGSTILLWVNKLQWLSIQKIKEPGKHKRLWYWWEYSNCRGCNEYFRM